MNSSKTEFMYYGTAKHIAKSEIHQIDINGDWVDRVSKMKYLGVWLDDQLNLKHHITMKCRTAMLNLQRIKLIRQYITKEACHTLVRGLVISHLDYSNAIFCGLPNCTIKKLECVQRIAARLIWGVKKYDSITEHMKSLHVITTRILIRQRIQFKLLIIVYNCVNGTAPEYLQNLITINPVNCDGLRSDQQYKKLVVPRTKCKTLAYQSFSVQGPELWNKLPDVIRRAANINEFKKQLKTHLFRKAYP